MVNKVILIGNVGADPEVRTLESGVKVATLRLATTERGKDKDGNATSHTEWHSVVVWRALADVVDKYVRKGSQLYIEGRLRTREWSTKEGEKRYSVEVICDSLQMIGKKSDSASQPTEPQPSERVAQAVESLQAAIDEDDKIPF